MKPKSYTYLIVLGVVVIIILIVLAVWPKSSGEKQAMDDCIQSGGTFSVSAQSCSPAATGTGAGSNAPAAASGTVQSSKPVTVGQITYSPASTTNMIKVDSPIPNATLYPSSLVSVKGKALGAWYFEATFPIQLVKADGTVISTSVAQAQSTWTVPGFVDFIGSISYPQQPRGTRGYVILKKDNPSGMSQNDASVKIPVTFE